MAAYPLSEVLTSILTSLSSAQRQSDIYSRDLYQQADGSELTILPVPWSQLNKVELDLRFAIASVGETTTGDGSVPEIDVYVTAEDLSPLNSKDISTLHIEIDVTDQEYVNTGEPS